MLDIYIEPTIAEEIKQKSILLDVVADYIQLKPSGSSHIGTCPACNSKKKFSVGKSQKAQKMVFKCFKCDLSGDNAVSFLTNTQGMKYNQALSLLATKYNISLNGENTSKKKTRGNRKISFRNQQLRDSGIPVKTQKYWLSQKESAKVECDRYQEGTIDNNWNVQPGDDMILHYIDLEGKPMTYINEKKKQVPLLRVRWSNPALHPDKNGKPMKYKSPWKSGSHLWIPNALIKAYQQGVIIETLYITEGEKKATKMCLHGMFTVGIMGINNFAVSNDMPHHFERIIKACGVAKVVFLLDSDWQDISIKNNQPVDSRPKSFYTAVFKFRRYFYAYANNGIELDIYFAHGKDLVHKGIDDLLVHHLKGNEEALETDFKKAFNDREGIGEYINIYDITQMNSYKLKEFWNLHSPVAFMNTHKEQLSKLREFKLDGLKRRINDEGEFELADALLPREQYWIEKRHEKRDGNSYVEIKFDYVNILEFLYNRGFGLYQNHLNTFTFIHINDKIVEETTPHNVQRYVLDFTRGIDKKDVLALLLRGGKQYLGQDKLSNMHYIHPSFLDAEKDAQYFTFKTVFWKITADTIEERPISELPKNVWKQKLLDFEPKYLGQPMVDIKRVGDDWQIKNASRMGESDIAMFYANTSNFHWKKKQRLHKDETGRAYFIEKEDPEPITQKELKLYRSNLVAKMLAAGYVLHDYRDRAELKAIIPMDAEESEVGTSKGGTGKSLYSTSFEHVLPTEVIDGKKRKLEDDPHLYDSVTERTQCIVFDDTRVNFDFEFLLSQITRGVEVNQKGNRKFKIPPPRIIIPTNHALNGDDPSFRRRQYILSFSDYYNINRTVGDDFGRQLFHEWDWTQWNYFYNWMATCVQLYLTHRLKYEINQEGLERRKLRQAIGENILEFASLFYSKTPDQNGKKGVFLNRKIEKMFLVNKYLDQFPMDKRYVNSRNFKAKLQKFAKYAGLDFNPIVDGGRLRSNGKEYFLLTDKDFRASDEIDTIHDSIELSDIQSDKF